MAQVEWRRIYEYPFTQLSHAFVGGKGCCAASRRHAAAMQKTIPPSGALDVCAACAKWLRQSCAATIAPTGERCNGEGWARATFPDGDTAAMCKTHAIATQQEHAQVALARLEPVK